MRSTGIADQGLKGNNRPPPSWWKTFFLSLMVATTPAFGSVENTSILWNQVSYRSCLSMLGSVLLCIQRIEMLILWSIIQMTWRFSCSFWLYRLKLFTDREAPLFNTFQQTLGSNRSQLSPWSPFSAVPNFHRSLISILFSRPQKCKNSISTSSDFSTV